MKKPMCLPKIFLIPESIPGLKDFSKMMEQLIADVSNVTLQQLFEKIITQCGCVTYILKSDEKIRLLQVLTALFDFIKEETARNPLLSLQGTGFFN